MIQIKCNDENNAIWINPKQVTSVGMLNLNENMSFTGEHGWFVGITTTRPGEYFKIFFPSREEALAYAESIVLSLDMEE